MVLYIFAPRRKYSLVVYERFLRPEVLRAFAHIGLLRTKVFLAPDAGHTCCRLCVPRRKNRFCFMLPQLTPDNVRCRGYCCRTRSPAVCAPRVVLHSGCRFRDGKADIRPSEVQEALRFRASVRHDLYRNNRARRSSHRPFCL